MNKEFIPYEQALELKQLGFDEPCFGRFDGRGKNKGKIWYEMPNTGQDSIPVGDVLAPTYSQAFKFFRKKYGLHHIIHCPAKNVANFTITGNIPSVFSNVELSSYEDAELACLKKLIELVKNK